MKRFLLVIALASIVLLSGCATPLGQQYGIIGGATGAAIGGAVGGIKGAIIGGAAGAATGGLIGDQQQLGHTRHHSRGCVQCYEPPQSYVRPCVPTREPVYDHYHNIVGWRTVCR